MVIELLLSMCCRGAVWGCEGGRGVLCDRCASPHPQWVLFQGLCLHQTGGIYCKQCVPCSVANKRRNNVLTGKQCVPCGESFNISGWGKGCPPSSCDWYPLWYYPISLSLSFSRLLLCGWQSLSLSLNAACSYSPWAFSATLAYSFAGEWMTSSI